MAHSRSFLANQKAGNAIVGPENLLVIISKLGNSAVVRKESTMILSWDISKIKN